MSIKIICFVIFLGLISCEKVNRPTKDIELISFHRGFLLWAEDLAWDDTQYDIEQIINGLRAAAAGKQLSISEEELAPIVLKFQRELVAKKNAENLAEAEEFLREISKGSIELIPSKLYFKKIKEGRGRAVTSKDTPFVIYTAKTVEEGVETDIFMSENVPVQISVSDTIPGFEKGIVGMLEGEKRRLYIHPELTKESYDFIPNKILIMDVEIIHIGEPLGESTVTEHIRNSCDGSHH